MKQKSNEVSVERRFFSRVMDAVGLEIQVLDDKAAAAPYSNAERRASVRVANKYDIPGYAEVKRDFSNVADYIDRLEERIRQLRVSGGPTAETPTHQVSLSACGIAFAHELLLLADNKIGIHLTLFPELIRISCKGKLIAVEDITSRPANGQHFYRVEFYDIAVEDQKIIDDHVSQLKRSIRSGNEPVRPAVS